MQSWLWSRYGRLDRRRICLMNGRGSYSVRWTEVIWGSGLFVAWVHASFISVTVGLWWCPFSRFFLWGVFVSCMDALRSFLRSGRCTSCPSLSRSCASNPDLVKTWPSRNSHTPVWTCPRCQYTSQNPKSPLDAFWGSSGRGGQRYFPDVDRNGWSQWWRFAQQIL